MLLEYFLKHCRFLFVFWIQWGHLSGHHGLMGLRISLQQGGNKGKADAAAGIANQILEAGGIADLFVAQRADRQRGQRHEDEADAEAGDYIWQNNAAYRVICRLNRLKRKLASANKPRIRSPASMRESTLPTSVPTKNSATNAPMPRGLTRQPGIKRGVSEQRLKKQAVAA